MEPIYITGHRNPDTDSIVAAISYAMLRNALGDRAYTAARIGELSDQTEMLLNKFDFPAPKMLHTVRTQVSDLDYDTPPILSAAVSVYHAWQTLSADTLGVPTLPVTDEDGRLYGMLTPEEIAAYDIRFIKSSRIDGIPLFNLLASLDGRLIHAKAEQNSRQQRGGDAFRQFIHHRIKHPRIRDQENNPVGDDKARNRLRIRDRRQCRQ